MHRKDSDRHSGVVVSGEWGLLWGTPAHCLQIGKASVSRGQTFSWAAESRMGGIGGAMGGQASAQYE